MIIASPRGSQDPRNPRISAFEWGAQNKKQNKTQSWDSSTSYLAGVQDEISSNMCLDMFKTERQGASLCLLRGMLPDSWENKTKKKLIRNLRKKNCLCLFFSEFLNLFWKSQRKHTLSLLNSDNIWWSNMWKCPCAAHWNSHSSQKNQQLMCGSVPFSEWGWLRLRERTWAIHSAPAGTQKSQDLQPESSASRIVCVSLMPSAEPQQANTDTGEHHECVWPGFYSIVTGLHGCLGNPNRILISPLSIAFIIFLF